jgi:hypothetical protein
MSDAGYTLVEALAALVMIGLAMGGLTVGIGVVSGAQSRATDAVAAAQAGHAAQAALERALQPLSPFRAHDGGRLTGDRTGFAYACGEDRPCRVDLQPAAKGPVLAMTDAAGVRRIALRRPGAVHFLYQGSLYADTPTALDAWPPTDAQRQALKAILVVDDAAEDRPLVTAKLWAEQPGRCDFDVVMQDCR